MIALEVRLGIHKYNGKRVVARAAAHATAVNFLAAVGYAVAAGAGGVVASAHTARVCPAADGDDDRGVAKRLDVSVELETILGAIDERCGVERAATSAQS